MASISAFGVEAWSQRCEKDRHWQPLPPTEGAGARCAYRACSRRVRQCARDRSSALASSPSSSRSSAASPPSQAVAWGPPAPRRGSPTRHTTWTVPSRRRAPRRVETGTAPRRMTPATRELSKPGTRPPIRPTTRPRMRRWTRPSTRRRTPPSMRTATTARPTLPTRSERRATTARPTPWTRTATETPTARHRSATPGPRSV
jgi:hypothetical protein